MLLRDVTIAEGLAALTFCHEFRGFNFSYVMSRVQTVQLLSRDVTSSDGLAAVTSYHEVRRFRFSHVMSRVQMV
jgi:hypothetical protein